METTLTLWALHWGVSPQALEDLGTRLMPPVTNRGEYSGESAVQAAIRLRASQSGARLFRNNLGACTTDDGRHIRFGLANDSPGMNKSVKSSDLIGITPVVIGPDRVGDRVGIFTSIEVKKPGWKFTGTERETAQHRWLKAVAALGGIAAFMTDPDQMI